MQELLEEVGPGRVREVEYGVLNLPVVGILEADYFGNHESILQGKTMISLVDGAFEKPSAYDILVLLANWAVLVLDCHYLPEVECLLRGRLPPILVNAVLELDDGEIADFERQGFVDKDRLRLISEKAIY